MTVITLTPRADVAAAEAPLTPEQLVGVGEREVARMPLRVGNRAVELGELFGVGVQVGPVGASASAGAATPELRVEAGGPRLHGLGTGMSSGRLVVEGDAGNRLGAGMSGGEIVVRGSCGDHAGAEMTGGRIRIEGDVGDRAGGAYPGGPKGMTGGVVLVHGRAGAEAGAAMRRGLIVIGGACGDRVALHAIAGTVVVFGDAGETPGLANKRGSVILHGAGATPPSYRFACVYEPPYVRVLLRHLVSALAFPLPERVRGGCYARWVGDFTELGKGEILRWQAS
ncbi:MAG: formylmethanofuran dehydrogenase subunit C [Gemmatimonadota bacterium]